MNSFVQQTVSHAARKNSCAARLHQALAIIEARSELNAFVEVFTDEALASALAIDAGPGVGMDSSIAGMFLGVKDNISIAGHACTAASRILDGYIAPYDATVVERLRAAAAVLVGRCNMDEFAMGSSGETSAYGPTQHPFLPGRVPGGSSSGSAAAVAAGLVDAALGSDTGGSIRQPAAFNGVVGLKPTWGRVSRFGLISFAPSFEQIGPITRTVRDAAAILGVIAGEDSRDATTVSEAVPDYPAACDRSAADLRIGILDEPPGSGDSLYTTAAVREAADRLSRAGAAVLTVSVGHGELVLPVYLVIANVETAGNLARYDGMRYGRKVDGESFEESVLRSRTEGFGIEVRRRLLQGAWIQGDGRQDEHYQRALNLRRLIRDAWLRVFDRVDVVIMPVTDGPPFAMGEKGSDAMAMRRSDVFTAAANVAGLPAISLPLEPSPEGFPRAVQLMARPFGEEVLFAAAAEIERSLPMREGGSADG